MKISIKHLRKIIKEEITLFESTSPDASVSMGIFQSILKSNFWTFPHNEDDVDLVDKATFSTPAIEVLMDALNDAAGSLGTDLYFILSVTDDETYTLSPADKFGGYPNGWLMRGQYRGPEKGKHIVWLEFRPLSEDYDMKDLDTKELSKIISRTINHELVHYNQLKKQAKNKNISEEDAWEEATRDPRQISQSGKYGDYLSLHNEIDAYAYEAAEEMLDKYDTSKVLHMLRTGSREASRILKDYASFLKGDNQSLQKFLKKVYTNVEQISSLDVE